MELFNFDIHKQELTVNKIELLTIPCFNKLINEHNDNTISLVQIFGYIFWVGSIFSPGIAKGLHGEDLTADAKLTLNIDNNWESNDLINECISKYKLLTESLEKEALTELLITLSNVKETASLLNRGLKTLITEINNQTIIDGTNINKLIGYNKSLNDILKDLPDNINKLRELLNSVYENNSGLKYKGRGKIEITGSMLDDD